MASANFEQQNISVPHLRQTKNWLFALLSQTTAEGAGAAPNHNDRLTRRDFSGYRLAGANLSGHDLSNANLRAAQLMNASLDNANLIGADLEDAELRCASLRDAKITADQIRQARDWLFGIYGDGQLRIDLKLPPDHDQPGPKKNFSHYDLSGFFIGKHNFLGCDLVGAFLEKCEGKACFISANLSGAKLAAAQLQESDFKEANVEKANLRGADLSSCTFEAASVDDADLHEAILRDAKLEKAKGLAARQLLGTDLTGASLPGGINEFKALETVKEAASASRKLLITMLAGCLYCGLTIGTTTDASLIGGAASIPLPFIQTPIPAVWFYILAPTILLVVYLYFLLSMHSLWESFASLPAIFPDGRPLHERAHPWVLNSIVRTKFKLLRGDLSLIARTQAILSTAVAWWVVPLTVLGFWMRFLVKRAPWITLLHLLLLLGCVVSAFILYWAAGDTLRGG